MSNEHDQQLDPEMDELLRQVAPYLRGKATRADIDEEANRCFQKVMRSLDQVPVEQEGVQKSEQPPTPDVLAASESLGQDSAAVAHNQPPAPMPDGCDPVATSVPMSATALAVPKRKGLWLSPAIVLGTVAVIALLAFVTWYAMLHSTQIVDKEKREPPGRMAKVESRVLSVELKTADARGSTKRITRGNDLSPQFEGTYDGITYALTFKVSSNRRMGTVFRVGRSIEYLGSFSRNADGLIDVSCPVQFSESSGDCIFVIVLVNEDQHHLVENLNVLPSGAERDELAKIVETPAPGPRVREIFTAALLRAEWTGEGPDVLEVAKVVRPDQ